MTYPRFSFTDAELLALLCACGECGIEPDTWACESRDDVGKVADAMRAVARMRAVLGEEADGCPCDDCESGRRDPAHDIDDGRTA